MKTDSILIWASQNRLSMTKGGYVLKSVVTSQSF